MAENLVNTRDWYSYQKAKLTARLANREGKRFEQTLKEIENINVEIRKLTYDIGDYKFWK